MSLIRHLAISIVVVLGCGPRTGDSPTPTDASWLLGVYSRETPAMGVEDSDGYVERVSLEDGGVGAWGRVAFEDVTDPRPVSWELTAPKEAALYPSPFDENDDEWHTIRPGADCNTLETREMNPNGSTGEPVPLHRGEVCTRQPDAGFPTYYERYWCDEPPPPCDGA